jgi:hypothetical protein
MIIMMTLCVVADGDMDHVCVLCVEVVLQFVLGKFNLGDWSCFVSCFGGLGEISKLDLAAASLILFSWKGVK